MAHSWPALLLLLMSVTGPTDLPATTSVVTPLDYFDSGRRQVDAYLERFGTLRALASELRHRCARLEVRTPHDTDTFTSVFGSGVLLGDGRHLLTAGHVLRGFENGEILVTFPGGDVFSAKLVDSRYEVFGEDWAILDLQGAAPRFGELQTAIPTLGSLAMVFGYPSHIGIDARGTVVFGESTTRYLEPIVTLGTVGATEPLTLDPAVGSVPTEGISGGPAFDRQGRLIGIMVAVQREPGAESRYHYRLVAAHGIPRIDAMTSGAQAGKKDGAR